MSAISSSIYNHSLQLSESACVVALVIKPCCQCHYYMDSFRASALLDQAHSTMIKKLPTCSNNDSHSYITVFLALLMSPLPMASNTRYLVLDMLKYKLAVCA